MKLMKYVIVAKNRYDVIPIVVDGRSEKREARLSCNVKKKIRYFEV